MTAVKKGVKEGIELIIKYRNSIRAYLEKVMGSSAKAVSAKAATVAS